MKALQAIIRRTGGPKVIEWVEVDLPPPGPGEVVMANEAVGVNFIDTYHRTGLYPAPLPSGLGMEAAGRVLAVGPDVAVKEGDRVATFGPERGAYSTARIVRAEHLLPVPDDVPSEIAAAALLKGCTAEFLAERCGKVTAGMDVLVHAAAGGVGLILVQWLKAVGARVIGTVSTEAKAGLAREAGADDIIRYDHEPVAERVRTLTGGKGCEVVFDGVGADTWEASLDSAARRGLIVSYGNASGPVTGVNLGVLAQKGSLRATRPTLFDYYSEPGERDAGIQRLWEMIRGGKLKVTVGLRYPLDEAAEAHRALEARQTTGSVSSTLTTAIARRFGASNRAENRQALLFANFHGPIDTMLLALDTATPACTAALFEADGTLLARADEVMSRGHAEKLMPLLDRLLEGRRADAILVGCGPGSFTGLRVGIAAAHGLAIGWDVPLFGLSTLALIAAGLPGDGPVAVALTGGHGELFVQQFGREPLASVAPVASLTPAAAAAAIDAPLVAGSGAATLIAARGWGEAADVLPSAVHALRLPEPLRTLSPRPTYARAPDAKPKAA